jgi:hypothetical protein
MHLGGQDVITAYNIEDNELWKRHVLTAVSQITVAIYVFCKSWPGGDKRLLQAPIVLFVPGILKCIEKPWAHKSSSINNRGETRTEKAGSIHLKTTWKKRGLLSRPTLVGKHKKVMQWALSRTTIFLKHK